MAKTAGNKIFEDIYARYNRREFVHPDPLEFLYDYADIKDREVVGLIASSLAYGRVAQILKSVSCALERMSSAPYQFLMGSSEKAVGSVFAGFKHRFTTGRELANLLNGAKAAIMHHGSLNKCFVAGLKEGHQNVLPALASFAVELAGKKRSPNYLVPTPEMGSACKRLNLFLRWMVRRDEVDPGGWTGVPASKLVVPLDTHMHKIGLSLGLTKRKSADIRAAVEVTSAFSAISPADPVRYDFALTRLGIRDDTDMRAFLNAAKKGTKGLSFAD